MLNWNAFWSQAKSCSREPQKSMQAYCTDFMSDALPPPGGSIPNVQGRLLNENPNSETTEPELFCAGFRPTRFWLLVIH